MKSHEVSKASQSDLEREMFCFTSDSIVAILSLSNKVYGNFFTIIGVTFSVGFNKETITSFNFELRKASVVYIFESSIEKRPNPAESNVNFSSYILKLDLLDVILDQPICCLK